VPTQRPVPSANTKAGTKCQHKGRYQVPTQRPVQVPTSRLLSNEHRMTSQTQQRHCAIWLYSGCNTLQHKTLQRHCAISSVTNVLSLKQNTPLLTSLSILLGIKCCFASKLGSFGSICASVVNCGTNKRLCEDSKHGKYVVALVHVGALCHASALFLAGVLAFLCRCTKNGERVLNNEISVLVGAPYHTRRDKTTLNESANRSNFDRTSRSNKTV